MNSFTVIDNKTGECPDCEKIALTEEWAKHLIYCDIDTFAITEDGSLILIDDCGNCAFCPADRFTVVFEKGGEDMPYIDTQYLFKCETCRHFVDNKCNTFGDSGECYSPNMYKIPTADVAPRAEVFEGVDKFRSDLMHKFIDLCRGNDYNKLTLLKIGDTVDQIYNKQIAELEKKYTDATDTNDGHK